MADLRLIPLKGLWETSSALAVAPPGSMELADDVCFRRLGTLEPLPDTDTLLEEPFAGGYTPRRMFDHPNWQMFVVSQVGDTNVWEFRWITLEPGSEAAQAAATLYGAAPTFVRGQVQAVNMRSYSSYGIQYITSERTLIKSDSYATLLRRVGLPAPLMMNVFTPVATDGRAIANNRRVNYRAIFVRRFTDKRTPEISGPPCTIVGYTNTTGGARNLLMEIVWLKSLQEIEVQSDSTLHVQLYRTKSVPSTQDPGDRMFLVTEALVDATAVTNGSVAVTDRLKDDELGEALYTNTGQEGISGAHYQPPQMADLTEYRGTLYGIATHERQSIQLFVSGFIGILATDEQRANGIGRRDITGDVSLGSPTMSNVSASHMKGIAVGQEITGGAGIPIGSRVISFTGSTITFDANSVATIVGQAFNLNDLLEIDGHAWHVVSPFAMQAQFYQDATPITLEALWSKRLDSSITVDSGQTLSLARTYARSGGTAFGVRATRGDLYVPKLNGLTGAQTYSDDDRETNRLGWCAPNQPDHWPLGNRETLGNGVLQRIVSTAEAMFAFSTDGRVYRISGQDSDLVVDVILEETYLAGANVVVAWAGSVYAWTNRGVMEIGDGGISVLSEPIKRALQVAYDAAVEATLGASGSLFNFDALLEVEKLHGELWLRTDPGASPQFIYNLTTAEWTRASVGLYAYRYSYDLRTLVTVEFEGEASINVTAFGGINSTAKRLAQWRLNRHDAGAPGVLKQWREIVLLFQKSSTAPLLAPTIAASVDKAAGGGGTVSVESIQLDTDYPTPHMVQVGKDAGLSTQWWMEYADAAGMEWALDGVIVRNEPKVDRTGSRST